MDLADAARRYQRAVSAVEAAKKAAERRITEARARVDAARSDLHTAIVEAAEEGVRPVQIHRVTGYTPERIRQILRAAGVEPAD